jgi:N-acetylmuramoyl-L-alanine amidase
MSPQTSEMMGYEQENLLKKYTTCSNTPEITVYGQGDRVFMPRRFRDLHFWVWVIATLLIGSVLLIGVLVIHMNIIALCSPSKPPEMSAEYLSSNGTAASPVPPILSVQPTAALALPTPYPQMQSPTADLRPSPVIILPDTTPRTTTTVIATQNRQYRVGIQVGHWLTENRPDESAHLRQSYGVRYGEISEVQVNYQVAIRVKTLLESRGIQVDLLHATVPPAYTADAFVALHADGSVPVDQHAHHGWKMAVPFLAPPASRHLLSIMSDEYQHAVDLPNDNERVTNRMRFYNAFNFYRYVHAIDPTTPAVIVEMGYLTHPADRALLLEQPDLLAQALAMGILRYLDEHDPDNADAYQMPPEILLQPQHTTNLRNAPSEDAPVVDQLTAAERLMSVEQANDWHFVLVEGSWDIGWVHVRHVRQITEE